MRIVIIAVTAVAVAAAPALAVDRGPYVGVEGGILFPRNTNYSVNSVRVQTVPTGSGLLGQSVTTTTATFGSGFVADYKRGVDGDIIVGYDFGPFRLEGELGYKRARVRDLTASTTLVGAINTAPITGVGRDDFSFGERTTVLSAMVNALLEFELSDRIKVYGGGGVGGARVEAFNDRDKAIALQLIGGISTALSDNVDLGIKYRYFRTGDLRFASAANFTGTGGSTSASTFLSEGKFRSHSALVGLTFHFGAAAPLVPPAPVEMAPPPPAPAPVAMQTCEDGSVIEAAAACPVIVAPPPPEPAAEPERG